jgi:signal peptidase I
MRQTGCGTRGGGQKMTNVEYSAFPSSEQVEAELNRVKYKNRYNSVLRSTVFTLLVVAAIAVLIATLWMPVLRIYGESMYPTLQDGNIVVTLKTSSFKEGSIVAFYYNNKVLVKRVIAGPGDWVDIDDDGNVYVNNVYLEEDYLPEGAKALGDTNITLPYQVPDGKYFVMGDNRDVSVDSRNTAVGCVSEEQLIGRLEWTVWPFQNFGKID